MHVFVKSSICIAWISFFKYAYCIDSNTAILQIFCSVDRISSNTTAKFATVSRLAVGKNHHDFFGIFSSTIQSSTPVNNSLCLIQTIIHTSPANCPQAADCILQSLFIGISILQILHNLRIVVLKSVVTVSVPVGLIAYIIPRISRKLDNTDLMFNLLGSRILRYCGNKGVDCALHGIQSGLRLQQVLLGVQSHPRTRYEVAS